MAPEHHAPRPGRRAATAAPEPDAPDPRYYDFRSLLRVTDEGPWLDRLDTAARTWIAEKHGSLGAGLPAVLSGDSFTTRLDGFGGEATRALRLTLAESGDQGEWLTEALGVEDSGGGGWLSVIVRNSEQRFGNRPRLVPRLLEELTILDGASDLDDATWVIGKDHFREFAAVLANEGRRAPVFVTAARPGQDPEQVREWMERRSRELAGLAHSYVLDHEANALLMHHLGKSMGVRPGSIRSFAPSPVPFDAQDALRHRRIGVARLETLPVRAAAALVGRIARFEAWATEEPVGLREARRVFDRRALSEQFRVGRRARGTGHPGPETPPTGIRPTGPSEPVLPRTAEHDGSPVRSSPRTPREGSAAPAPVLTPSSPMYPGPAKPDDAGAVTSPRTATPPKDPRPAAGAERSGDGGEAQGPSPLTPTGSAADPALAALLEATGTGSLEEALDWARTMSEVLEDAERDALDRQAHAERMADATEELERSRAGLERELAREIDRRHTAESNARALSSFAPGGTSGPSDVDAPGHPADEPFPEQFSDIPIMALDLERYVEFTGDPATTEALDEYDTNTVGAKRCWEGLLALYDYARARAEGVHDEGLYGYLRTTPSGYAGFGVSHYAARESETTTARRDLADQRLLPVPAAVDPAGHVHMWAHLKLTQVGRISPRLHFHDDVGGTGKVYVGYIGRHLGTSGG